MRVTRVNLPRLVPNLFVYALFPRKKVPLKRFCVSFLLFFFLQLYWWVVVCFAMCHWEWRSQCTLTFLEAVVVFCVCMDLYAYVCMYGCVWCVDNIIDCACKLITVFYDFFKFMFPFRQSNAASGQIKLVLIHRENLLLSIGEIKLMPYLSIERIDGQWELLLSARPYKIYKNLSFSCIICFGRDG